MIYPSSNKSVTELMKRIIELVLLQLIRILNSVKGSKCKKTSNLFVRDIGCSG